MLNALYLIFFTANYNAPTWESAVEFCMSLQEPCLNIEESEEGYYRAIYERPFWK